MNDMMDSKKIRDLEVKIIQCKANIAENILEIGDMLIEAKALLAHGEFLPWLESHVGFSDRTARNFMQAARAFPAEKRKAISDLTSTNIILIAQQPEERRAKLLADPEIATLSTRELKAKINGTSEDTPDADVLTQPIFTDEMRQFSEKVLASNDISLITKWHGFLKEMLQGESEIVIDLECKIGELLAITDGEKEGLKKYSGKPFEIAIDELKPYPGYDEFAPILYREGDEYENFLEFVREYGVDTYPIMITDGNMILDGHERVRALKDLGKTKINAVYLPIDIKKYPNMSKMQVMEIEFYKWQYMSSFRTEASPFFALLYYTAINDVEKAMKAWERLNECEGWFLMKAIPILDNRGFLPNT